MNCPKPSILEDLVAGRLDVQQEEELLGHLFACTVCSEEVAFLKAASLVAQGLSDKEGCLSDEMLCAYADGAMAERESQQVLAHLSRCSECSANLANLVRSLDESISEEGQPLIAPPRALLNRAIRIGAAGRSASEKVKEPSGLLSFFKKSSLPWRMAFAGSVAGAILLLVIVVSGPMRSPSMHDKIDAGLRAWRAEQIASVEKTKTGKMNSVTPVVQKQVENSASEKTAVKDSHRLKNPDSVNKTRSAGAMASLSSERRAGIATSLVPGGLVPSSMEKAFAGSMNATANGYEIGRALVFLERFRDYTMESAGLRNSTVKVLSSLEGQVRGAPFSDGKDGIRMVGFISKLTKDIESGKIESGTASRRIGVLCEAIKSTLDKNGAIASSARLGILVQSWSTDELTENTSVSVGKGGLKRARELIRSGTSLSDKARKAALMNIEKLEQSAKIENSAQRTQKILEELRNLDQTLVHNLPPL